MSATEHATPIRTPSADEVSACRPIAVVWEITLSCNLKCAHCGSRAGAPRANELSTAEAFALIQDLAAIGVRDVGLIGGEVYLRHDWLQLITAIKRQGMRCSMQTGGRALTEAKIAAAAIAGLDSAGVSVDGMAANHDFIRGVPGSFAHAVAALHNFHTHRVPTTVNTQLWTRSIDDLPELLSLVAQAGVTTWQLGLTVAMGNAADNPDILLQPHRMLDIMPLLARLYDEAAAKGIRIVLANNVGYFGPFEAKLRSVEEVATHWDGCSAGRNVIGIEADGKIKGCPSLDTATYTGGNIRDKSLQEIWSNSRELAFARNRQVDDLWGFCRSCYYADVCHAGCTWTTHSLFGRPGNNPFCHYRALTLQKRGLRERIRQVRAAPGVPFDNGIFELVVEDMAGNFVKTEQIDSTEFALRDVPAMPARERTSLLLCAGCENFVLPHETQCPHCGGGTLESREQRKQRADIFAPTLSRLRTLFPTADMNQSV